MFVIVNCWIRLFDRESSSDEFFREGSYLPGAQISERIVQFHQNWNAFSGSTKLSISVNIRKYYERGMTRKLRTCTGPAVAMVHTKVRSIFRLPDELFRIFE